MRLGGLSSALRESDDPRLCLLVIIGVRADGAKEWVAIDDGLRESTESRLDVLGDLKARGLELGPRLAVGDGALGFWNALEQDYPETRHQRCCFHKLGNVLNTLPKSLQGKAKAHLQAIWIAPTRKAATQAFQGVLKRYGAKYPKAAEKLETDREAFLRFFDFPADHWVHLRTTNPSESTFATVRHRTRRTKNCVTRDTFLGLAFKLSEEAASVGDESVPPRRSPICSMGRAMKMAFRCPTTHRTLPTRSNGTLLEQARRPQPYTRFANISCSSASSAAPKSRCAVFRHCGQGSRRYPASKHAPFSLNRFVQCTTMLHCQLR